MHEVELCVSERVQKVPQLVRINPGLHEAIKIQAAIWIKDLPFEMYSKQKRLKNKEGIHLKSKYVIMPVTYSQ